LWPMPTWALEVLLSIFQAKNKFFLNYVIIAARARQALAVCFL